MAEGLDKNQPQGEGGEPKVVAIDIIGKRKGELLKALTEAEIAFKDAGRKLLLQIGIWTAICLILMYFIYRLYFCYLFCRQIPDSWTWQVIYFTAVRLTFITAVFFVGIYVFKMLSSTFQMYQHNKHKHTVIKSLPSLIVAIQHTEKDVNQTSVEQFAVYNKILDILIAFSNTGIIGREHELKPTTDIINKIIEALKIYKGLK